MAIPYLLPGQEYCRIRADKKVEYAYCSPRGRYFSCVSTSEKAAREQCEYWLLRQERN